MVGSVLMLAGLIGWTILILVGAEDLFMPIWFVNALKSFGDRTNVFWPSEKRVQVKIDVYLNRQKEGNLLHYEIYI